MGVQRFVNIKQATPGSGVAAVCKYEIFWILFLFLFSGVCLDNGILNLTRHLSVLGKLH